MTGLFHYAAFDQFGRCTGIMQSAVDLGLPHSIEGGSHPGELFLDESGEVRRRIEVLPTISRGYLISDGADQIDIAGIEEDVRLLVNGVDVGPLRAIRSGVAETLVIEVAPPFVAEPMIVEAAPREQLIERFSAEVDAVADAVRSRLGASGALQQDIHRRKEAEARAVMATAEPFLPSAIPFLKAEAEARAIGIRELAAEVIGKADAWAALSARIEALRVAAKRKIAAAADVETMIAAKYFAWPEPAAEGEE